MNVEAGILNIESDADNTARQRIPITKAWPKLFMGRKKTPPKNHAAVHAPQLNTSCGFGLVVWVFLITLYFDQRKQKPSMKITSKKH